MTSFLESPAWAFFFAGIKHFERVARRRLALEVDVVGIDADHFVDDRARNLVAQRGLVNALIEAHAGAVVLLFLLIDAGDRRIGALHIDQHVVAEIGQRDHGIDRAVADDDHAQRLQPCPRSLPAGRAASGLP